MRVVAIPQTTVYYKGPPAEIFYTCALIIRSCPTEKDSAAPLVMQLPMALHNNDDGDDDADDDDGG